MKSYVGISSKKIQTIGAWEDNQGGNLKLLYKGSREYKIPKDPKTQTKGKAQVPDFLPISPLNIPGQKGTMCQPKCKNEQGQITIRRTSLVSGSKT